MTIERILPNQMSETEFFNQQRQAQGIAPIQSKVTKIRPGLQCACGPNCHIQDVEVGRFTKAHNKGCSIRWMEGRIETVGDGTEQALARLRDDDGTIIHGILVLSGLFPHEMA